MKTPKPKNSATVESLKRKLEKAQKSQLRGGFLSQDKFPTVQIEPKKPQIS
jgi:hypothetical protein